MLAAEQGAVHDDPGSVEASLDGTLRKFFLHDAPYGVKSVLIHYLNLLRPGIFSLPMAALAWRLDGKQCFFRKRKPIVALM